jgi:capsular exopolysaccharide synthesis family protein
MHESAGRHAEADHIPNIQTVVFEALKTHWILILLLSLLGGVIGFGWFLMKPPMYMSSTTLELQGFNEGFMNLNQIDPQAGSYSPTTVNISTQLRIIESASLRGPVLDRLTREAIPIPAPQAGAMAKLRAKLGLSGVSDPLEQTKTAVRIAASNVDARAISGTRIILLSVSSTIPEVAASFANSLASEYMAQNSQGRTGSVQRMSQWLEGQLADTQYRLAQSEAKLQEFVRRSGTVFVETDTLADTRLKQAQAELATIQSDRIAKQSKYELVSKAPLDSLPEVLDDGSLRGYMNQLAALKRERALLLTTLTEQNPRVQKIDAQIGELEKSFHQERASVIRRVKNDFDAALRREQLLLVNYKAQSGAVIGQADKVTEYNSLKREVETSRMNLNNLMQQANQANVASGLPTNNVRVIDGAQAARQPYSPNPYSGTSSGVTLGFAAGAGIALLRVFLRKRRQMQSFAAPGHSVELLEVPELGVIPTAHAVTAKRKILGLRGSNGTSSYADQDSQTELLAVSEKPVALVDSFRLILASLTMMQKHGFAPKTIMISSGGPGEGKTTVMSNLALVMAEARRRVVLVDADLRKPSLHRLFGIENERGFADLIDDASPVDPSKVRAYLQQTKFPGLSVMTSGTYREISRIHHLLYSPRIGDILQVLRDEADVVLIDVPPMLQFFESRLIARLTDGVILVLRAGATNRATAMECRQQLALDGVPLLGTVLNDWNPSKSGSGGSYYTSGYYRYYSEAREK